jgi:pyridoxamine 5'-phosphate oxidase
MENDITIPPIDAIEAVRKEYTAGSLSEDLLAVNPLDQFEAWFSEACNTGVVEPNAMALATVDTDGYPHVRMVLLKSYSSEGFSFFTNTESNKGKQLAALPRAAVVFFWKELERQVRIEGSVQAVSAAEADAYFASRPIRAQLGAIASKQSSPLWDRAMLEKAVADLETQLDGAAPKRPAHWGGYRIVPEIYEFWQGRPDRLHDRFMYTKEEQNKWAIQRMYP